MMKNIFKRLIILSFSLICCGVNAQSKGLVTFSSPHTVQETENRLISILNKKEFKIFKQVDHSAGAKAVGIPLNETKLVIFGKPQIGSKLMQCSPSLAIDLPQKMLIWREAGMVKLAFNSPKFLAKRHQVKGCEGLFKKINQALNNIAKRVVDVNPV